jgi:catechol 2,3-dioxygenase-like lactoylglutathione lyase family enzyme
MPVSVSKIGHIVLKVEDLDSACAFYCGILGLKEIARRDFGEGPMAFLSTGNSHHDIALVAANPPNSGSGWLHHFVLKVVDSLQNLRQVSRHSSCHRGNLFLYRGVAPRLLLADHVAGPGQVTLAEDSLGAGHGSGGVWPCAGDGCDQLVRVRLGARRADR